MKAKWKPGARNAGVPANAAAVEIDKAIKHAAKNGVSEPEALFDLSADPDAPLHNAFEWDKEKGWRAHNIEIARSLIYNIVIEKPRPRPLYVSVVRDNDRGYIKTNRPSASDYRAVLDQIVNDVKAYAASRCSGFEELAPLRDMIQSWTLPPDPPKRARRQSKKQRQPARV